jgi:hypothetical protein
MPEPVASACAAFNGDGTHMSARAHRDVDSAIRQLRRKRRAIVEHKRRRRGLLAGAGALAFALATATTVATFAGTDLAGAAVSRAQSFMDLMGQRSPGARTEAQLTKTKRKHQVLAEREGAPVAPVPANLAELIAPPVPAIVPLDLGPPPALEFAGLQPPGPLFFSPPGGGGPRVPPGGGGGCCGVGPPQTPRTPTPPTTPAVPEPGTWMTMLLGFGFMGWTLRRSRDGIKLAA